MKVVKLIETVVNLLKIPKEEIAKYNPDVLHKYLPLIEYEYLEYELQKDKVVIKKDRIEDKKNKQLKKIKKKIEKENYRQKEALIKGVDYYESSLKPKPIKYKGKIRIDHYANLKRIMKLVKRESELKHIQNVNKYKRAIYEYVDSKPIPSLAKTIIKLMPEVLELPNIEKLTRIDTKYKDVDKVHKNYKELAKLEIVNKVRKHYIKELKKDRGLSKKQRLEALSLLKEGNTDNKIIKKIDELQKEIDRSVEDYQANYKKIAKRSEKLFGKLMTENIQ